MESSLEIENGKKKRMKPYVKNACLHCSNAHLSCSQIRPCPRCVAKGIECQEKPSKRRRKDGTNTAPEVQSQVINFSLPGISYHPQAQPALQTLPTQSQPPFMRNGPPSTSAPTTVQPTYPAPSYNQVPFHQMEGPSTTTESMMASRPSASSDHVPRHEPQGHFAPLQQSSYPSSSYGSSSQHPPQYYPPPSHPINPTPSYTYNTNPLPKPSAVAGLPPISFITENSTSDPAHSMTPFIANNETDIHESPPPSNQQTVPNFSFFSDMSRLEMSVWHRKTFKLMHANKTFLSSHRLRSAEAVNNVSLFETLLPMSLNAYLPTIQQLIIAVVDPKEFGMEPFSKSFWNKFYAKDVDGTMMISLSIIVEKEYFYFERSRFRIGKVDVAPANTNQDNNFRGYFFDEFQLNECEVQRLPYTDERSLRNLCAKIIHYIETQKNMFRVVIE